MSDGGEVAIQIVSNVLLFMLLAGMAASVDTECLRDSFKRWRGIAVGLLCQFVILPMVGFISVTVFDLKSAFGIALLVTTASPGGAYSNWWCSLMNADLALSIAMTTCSTAASIIFMPVNILLYTTIAYGESPDINFWRILLGIGVAVGAIITGTLISAKRPSWRPRANIFGNVAGIVLIVFGMLVSSSDEPLWDKEPKFYLAVSAPCLTGLLLALAASFTFVVFGRMVRPEAVSVCVEVCYQNTGLALSIALASFDGDERGDAAAVPLFYAVCQVILLPTFLLLCWKSGWTYAPSSIRVDRMIVGNFQPVSESKVRELAAIDRSTDSSCISQRVSEKTAADWSNSSQQGAPHVVPSAGPGREPVRLGAEASPCGSISNSKTTVRESARSASDQPSLPEVDVIQDGADLEVGSPLAANGTRPLRGNAPDGVVSKAKTESQPEQSMSALA